MLNYVCIVSTKSISQLPEMESCSLCSASSYKSRPVCTPYSPVAHDGVLGEAKHHRRNIKVQRNVSLLNEVEALVTEDAEKVEIRYAFLASVFN